MYRRFISILLALLLLISPLCAPEAQAVLAAGLTITDIAENGDGTVTITWEDPEHNGPYLVGWLENTSGIYMLDSYVNAFAVTAWYMGEKQTGNSVRLGDLLPGISYWVYVEDSKGHTAHMLCERPEAQPFAGPHMTVVVKPRMQSSGGLSAFKNWSATAIENAAEGVEHGVRLEVTHGYMATEATYYMQLAVTDPHGESVAVISGDFTTGGRSGSKTTFFNFCGFGWYFDALRDAYGEIPLGMYTLSLYLDGGHVADHTFEMME